MTPMLVFTFALVVGFGFVLPIETQRRRKGFRSKLAFYRSAKQLLKMHYVPSEVFDVLEYMNENIDNHRVSRKFLLLALSGKLRDTAESPRLWFKKDIFHAKSKIDLAPACVRLEFHRAIEAFIIANSYSLKFIFGGAFLRRIVFYSISHDISAPMLIILGKTDEAHHLNVIWGDDYDGTPQNVISIKPLLSVRLHRYLAA
jgi:hypothetical protein